MPMGFSTASGSEQSSLLRNRNVSNQQLVDELSSPYSNYRGITAQEIYDARIRPREEAELARQLAQVRQAYQNTVGSAQVRNEDLSRRLGLSGTTGGRIGQTLTSQSSRGLGDALANRAAAFERELQGAGRFSLLETLQQARARRASSDHAFSSFMAGLTATAGTVLGTYMGGPAAGAALGGVTGALGAGSAEQQRSMGSDANERLSPGNVKTAKIQAPAFGNTLMDFRPQGGYQGRQFVYAPGLETE